MPVININGVGLNYRQLGSRDKRTIGFAHIALFGSDVFDHLASELINDFHLILDQRALNKNGASARRSLATEPAERLMPAIKEVAQRISESGVDLALLVPA